MKLLVSREWMREKILADHDVDTDAGAALVILEGLGVTVSADISANEVSIDDQKTHQLSVAFGSFIRQLRMRERLTVSALSKKLDVTESELRSIEHDPHYRVRPRTLHCIAKFFRLPLRQLMELSGTTRVVDRALYNEAIGFAAHADDLCELSEEETAVLFRFVKYLNDREETC